MPGNSNENPPDQTVATKQTFWTTFQINNTKLHAPVVTYLSVNDNIKILGNIRYRKFRKFKRTNSSLYEH